MTRAERFVILALVAALGLTSCDREERQNQMIVEQGVKIKIDEFVARRNKICHDDAVKRAMVVADSILREEGFRTRIEPVEKPPVAQKPSRPAIRTLPDSVRMDRKED